MNTKHENDTANGPISVETLERLKAAARTASEHAYCPYSGFRVGAAVLTTTGQIFTGCNVENASYGLTICAERTAVFQMVAQHKEVDSRPSLRAVAVYVPQPHPAAPCGACRQVLSEFATTGPVRILGLCDSTEALDTHLHDLLPSPFGPGNISEDADKK